MTPTRGPALSEINITPLIDVMLVLLIIFMVVTPTAARHLAAALPDTAKAGSHSPPPLLVRVDPSALSVNGRPVADLNELATLLRESLALRSERALFVRAHDDVGYAWLVDVIDVAREAGAERIGLMAEALPAEPLSTTR